LAYATNLGSVLDGDKMLLPEGFPASAQFGDEFPLRLFSAARTYKRREAAQNLIPLGATKMDLNYSIERKRVLNAARVVTKDDNIKQHSHTHKVL